MKEIDINEIKQIELGILDEFDAFCNEHDLSYSLARGTLLGAVRHKGFIPWDDDIDVVMPRNDYDRLLSLEASFPKPYSVKSFRNDNWRKTPYIYTYIKITDNRTMMIELPETLGYKTGIYIDVLPLDGLPNEEEATKERYEKARELIYKGYVFDTAKYFAKSIKIKNFKSLTKKLRFYLIDIIRKCMPAHYYYKKLEQYSKEYTEDTSDIIGVVIASDYGRELMPKDRFYPLQKISFEGRMYSAMNDPDYYLKRAYGDYMKLPPIDERKKRHDNISWWIDK